MNRGAQSLEMECVSGSSQDLEFGDRGLGGRVRHHSMPHLLNILKVWGLGVRGSRLREKVYERLRLASAEPQAGIRVRVWGSVSGFRVRVRCFGVGSQGFVSIGPTPSLQDPGSIFWLNVKLETEVLSLN